MFLITHGTWQNLDAPSYIQQVQLNCNNLKPDISSEPLIDEFNLDPMVTPNLPYKLRCSLTL